MPTPTIFDLANDADSERFFLSTTQPTPNSDGVPARDFLLSRRIPFRNDGFGTQGEPRFIVLHVQEGVTIGSLEHWTRGLDSKGNRIAASSTVMIQKDGSVLRVIPEEHGPWTNGDTRNPTPQAAGILALGADPNLWSLTIEAEGMPDDEMPQAQLDSIVWQVRQWMDRFGIPVENVLPHSAINSVTRHQCPGGYYRRVIEALGGEVSSDHGGGAFAQPTPPPPFDGQAKSVNGLTYEPFQAQVISSGVNRRLTPSAAAPMTGPQIPAGVTIDVLYRVEGEAVGGNNVWLVGDSGSFIWSGGVEGTG